MSEQSFVCEGPRHPRRNIAERLAYGLAQTLLHALDAEGVSQRHGFLQGLDPRIKLLGLLALILASVAARQLLLLAGLFVLALMLARGSCISLGRLYRQVWLSVLLFTGCIALPAVFLVPGAPLATVPGLHWHLTLNGVRSAGFLVGRAETSATFALLLMLSTPWPHVLKALRCLGVPVVLVAILGMTHRYIFVLLGSAAQLVEARRSRIMAPMTPAGQRKMIASTAGVLLAKSIQLSTEVHLAMLSRGFRGEVVLLDEFRLRWRDGFALAVALMVLLMVFWIQQ